MDHIIETNKLSKKYGRQFALKDASISIPKGSIYGLVGRNGAGKTTFMRLITGLQKPSEGDYRIFGMDYRDKEIARQRKRIGALIEKPGIFADLNAYSNIKTQYINLGLPSYDGIDELLELVGLSGTGKKLAGMFSLGMKQRLGIAIALAGSPDLLVLDEPINGLDPEGIVNIREMLLKINRERGTTILISSHILGELEHLATDYAFIEKGRIVEQISAEEMKRKCRKSTLLRVTKPETFCKILDDMEIEYQITAENELTLYGDFTLSDVVIAASKEGADVLSSTVNDENLESYFLDIIGGRE